MSSYRRWLSLSSWDGPVSSSSFTKRACCCVWRCLPVSNEAPMYLCSIRHSLVFVIEVIIWFVCGQHLDRWWLRYECVLALMNVWWTVSVSTLLSPSQQAPTLLIKISWFHFLSPIIPTGDDFQYVIKGLSTHIVVVPPFNTSLVLMALIWYLISAALH